MSKSNQRTIVNPFKPLINRLPKGLQNRYYLVLIVFMLWILIFDKANVWEQYKLQRTIKRLESDKIFYQNKLKAVQQEKIDIERDKEKFAREHYYMKANDEDVFVIEKKK
jgi:cell division protein DivIC